MNFDFGNLEDSLCLGMTDLSLDEPELKTTFVVAEDDDRCHMDDAWWSNLNLPIYLVFFDLVCMTIFKYSCCLFGTYLHFMWFLWFLSVYLQMSNERL